MNRVMLGVLLVTLTSCAGSFAGRAPETRTVPLPGTPAQAYQRAYQTLTAMGAQFTVVDGHQHLQGVLKGVVLLSVAVQGQGPQTAVQVTGSIPPGKLTLGTFTELDEFCTRLAATEQAHAR